MSYPQYDRDRGQDQPYWNQPNRPHQLFSFDRGPYDPHYANAYPDNKPQYYERRYDWDHPTSRLTNYQPRRPKYKTIVKRYDTSVIRPLIEVSTAYQEPRSPLLPTPDNGASKQETSSTSARTVQNTTGTKTESLKAVCKVAPRPKGGYDRPDKLANNRIEAESSADRQPHEQAEPPANNTKSPRRRSTKNSFAEAVKAIPGNRANSAVRAKPAAVTARKKALEPASVESEQRGKLTLVTSSEKPGNPPGINKPVPESPEKSAAEALISLQKGTDKHIKGAADPAKQKVKAVEHLKQPDKTIEPVKDLKATEKVIPQVKAAKPVEPQVHSAEPVKQQIKFPEPMMEHVRAVEPSKPAEYSAKPVNQLVKNVEPAKVASETDGDSIFSDLPTGPVQTSQSATKTISPKLLSRRSASPVATLASGSTPGRSASPASERSSPVNASASSMTLDGSECRAEKNHDSSVTKMSPSLQSGSVQQMSAVVDPKKCGKEYSENQDILPKSPEQEVTTVTSESLRRNTKEDRRLTENRIPYDRSRSSSPKDRPKPRFYPKDRESGTKDFTREAFFEVSKDSSREYPRRGARNYPRTDGRECRREFSRETCQSMTRDHFRKKRGSYLDVSGDRNTTREAHRNGVRYFPGVLEHSNGYFNVPRSSKDDLPHVLKNRPKNVRNASNNNSRDFRDVPRIKRNVRDTEVAAAPPRRSPEKRRGRDDDRSCGSFRTDENLPVKKSRWEDSKLDERSRSDSEMQPNPASPLETPVKGRLYAPASPLESPKKKCSPNPQQCRKRLSPSRERTVVSKSEKPSDVSVSSEDVLSGPAKHAVTSTHTATAVKNTLIEGTELSVAIAESIETFLTAHPLKSDTTKSTDLLGDQTDVPAPINLAGESSESTDTSMTGNRKDASLLLEPCMSAKQTVTSKSVAVSGVPKSIKASKPAVTCTISTTMPAEEPLKTIATPSKEANHQSVPSVSFGNITSIDEALAAAFPLTPSASDASANSEDLRKIQMESFRKFIYTLAEAAVDEKLKAKAAGKRRTSKSNDSESEESLVKPRRKRRRIRRQPLSFSSEDEDEPSSNSKGTSQVTSTLPKMTSIFDFVDETTLPEPTLQSIFEPTEVSFSKETCHTNSESTSKTASQTPVAEVSTSESTPQTASQTPVAEVSTSKPTCHPTFQTGSPTPVAEVSTSKQTESTCQTPVVIEVIDISCDSEPDLGNEEDALKQEAVASWIQNVVPCNPPTENTTSDFIRPSSPALSTESLRSLGSIATVKLPRATGLKLENNDTMLRQDLALSDEEDEEGSSFTWESVSASHQHKLKELCDLYTVCEGTLSRFACRMVESINFTESVRINEQDMARADLMSCFVPRCKELQNLRQSILARLTVEYSVLEKDIYNLVDARLLLDGVTLPLGGSLEGLAQMKLLQSQLSRRKSKKNWTSISVLPSAGKPFDCCSVVEKVQLLLKIFTPSGFKSPKEKKKIKTHIEATQSMKSPFMSTSSYYPPPVQPVYSAVVIKDEESLEDAPQLGVPRSSSRDSRYTSSSKLSEDSVSASGLNSVSSEPGPNMTTLLTADNDADCLTETKPNENDLNNFASPDTKQYSSMCMICPSTAEIMCSTCKKATYCSRVCQQKDWISQHYTVCRE